MKRILFILLCIVLSIALSCCGTNQSADNEPETLVPSADPDAVLVDEPALSDETTLPERDWAEVFEAVLRGDNADEIHYLEFILPENQKDITDMLQVYDGAGLYDINSDGTPELFILVGLYEGHYYDVYAYENNRAKRLLRSGAGNIEQSTGVLFGVGGDAGYNLDEAYRMENGELLEIPNYAETVFAETGGWSVGYRLGNRAFLWGDRDYNGNLDDVMAIRTFYDFEDALNYYQFGIEPVEEAPQTYSIFETTSNVNLREGPGTGFNRLITIPRGTNVRILDFLDYDWFLVDHEGQVGYVKAEYLKETIVSPAQTETADSPAQAGTTDSPVQAETAANSGQAGTTAPSLSGSDQAVFLVLKDQLLPQVKQSSDEEFVKAYQKLVDVMQRKDLAALDSLLDEAIQSSFGGHNGKSDFYAYWGLIQDVEHNAFWVEMEKILQLGGVYNPATKTFVAPYTFANFELDAYGHYVIIDKNVAVYAEANLSSEVIDRLQYNIVQTNVWYVDNRDIAQEFWDKGGQDLVKIQTLSGKSGYIQKQYLRSPIDYRFGFRRNDSGDWKITFMLSGD
ncbi:MAG: SH3 domain-containing protein [Clostridiales bacterium]|nr:SH3 domain-containing protein [Clostridiales bacterium]